MFESCANLYLTPDPAPASGKHEPERAETSEPYDVMPNKLLEILFCAETRRIYRLQRGEKRIKILDVHHIGAIG